MNQASLHTTQRNPIKKKKRIVKPAPSKEELAILMECNAWKDKIRLLQQVKRYQQKEEEQELKRLISSWRKVAQDVARELGSHFSKDEPFIEPYFLDDEQPQAKQADPDEPNDEEDPMGRMLSLLRIDHDLIHYSLETESFYD